MSEVVGTVNAVRIFPIKSLREGTVTGEIPHQLEVGETGFVSNGFSDRGMVIAARDGLFVSQRGWNESMAVKFPKDKKLATVSVDIQTDHLVVVTDLGSIEIGHAERDRLSQEVRIFGAPFYGFDVGNEAADYFSQFLDREVRLFEVDSDKPRLFSEEFQCPDAFNKAAAADGFPFLLANQASLDEAHDRAGLPRGTLPITAYRANIDAILGEPWLEDRLKKIKIKDFTAYVLKACSRCPIPNQDQLTGARHGLSNKVLRNIRTGWRVGKDPNVDDSEMYFGDNLGHTIDSLGSVIAEGDGIIADEIGESNFIVKASA